jgi:hypothetical protein
MPREEDAVALLRPDAVPALAGADDGWLARNVPYFECPDAAIQQAYYFRWDVYRKHLKETPEGYIVTEFLPDVSWAGAYNTISASAGHHLYEGRWLHVPVYLDDYTRFWFGPRGEPRRYSCWLADAVYARYLVTGDAQLPVSLLDSLVHNYMAWEAERRDESGLFWQLDDRDGMEHQIGGSGLRPTINSYLYGDAVAIARLAALAGRGDVATAFAQKAARLKRLVQERLWDADARFFKTRPTALALERQAARYDGRTMGPRHAPGTLVDVRELQGYVPWYFGLPDPAYDVAWAQLRDHEGFWGAYGPSTAERRHPWWWPAPTVRQHDCLWRGSSWPYATSQTLVALANLLQGDRRTVVSERDYFDLLRIYARSHRLTRPDGSVIPWIDESLHPDTGEWVTRATLHARQAPYRDRGRDYNHSTFCDLVITGLVGLRPRADAVLEVHPLVPTGAWEYFCLDRVRYHGRLVSILYDRTGRRYGRGAGLRVYAEGREIAAADTLRRIAAPL